MTLLTQDKPDGHFDTKTGAANLYLEAHGFPEYQAALIITLSTLGQI